MRIEHSRLDGIAVSGAVAVAVGFFDGFHIGHRAVADAAIGEARRTGVEAWAFTFAEHPLATIAPDRAPPLLQPREERIAALEKAGFDGVCLVEFDARIAALDPCDFALRLKRAFPRLMSVHCGVNWRFGAGAAGDAAALAALGAGLGFRVSPAPPVAFADAPVSSTRIRAALAAGDLDSASAMLGRPYSLAGTVVKGRGLGSSCGVPTANIGTAGLATPPAGVYAVAAEIGGAMRPGVADLGWRPTFPDARPDAPVLEVNFFGIDRDLYGMRLDVVFAKYLRGEMAFPSKEALFGQIKADIAAAKAAARRLEAFPCGT